MNSAEEQRQRVTVVSPFGQHQVDLPADVPVSGFLPELLAMAGLHPSHTRPGGAGWQLEDAEGRVLPADGTLAASGIGPGAVIVLRSTHPPVGGLAAVGLAPEIPLGERYPDPGYPAAGHPAESQEQDYPPAGQPYPPAGPVLTPGNGQDPAFSDPINLDPINSAPTNGYADQALAGPGFAGPGYAQLGYPGLGYSDQGYAAAAQDHPHSPLDQAQPSQAQAEPGQPQFGQAQFGQAQFGEAQFGAAQPDLAQLGVAQPDLAQPGQAHVGQAQPDQAQPGPAQPGQADFGQGQPYLAQADQTQSDQTQHGQAQTAGQDQPPAATESELAANGQAHGYPATGLAASQAHPGQAEPATNGQAYPPGQGPSYLTPGQEPSHPASAQETARPAPGQGISDQSPGQGISGPIPGLEPSHPAPAQKTARPAPGQGISGPIPGLESSHPAPARETSQPAPGQENLQPAPGQETMHPASGQGNLQPPPGQETPQPTPGQGAAYPAAAQGAPYPAAAQGARYPAPDTGPSHPAPGQGKGHPADAPMSRPAPRHSSPSGPPDDTLTPLQRVHAVLPERVSLPNRLAAATAAFFQSAAPAPFRPVTPDELARSAQPGAPVGPGHPGAPPTPGAAAGPGTGHAGPGQSAAAPEPRGQQVSRPSGKHRLLPSDLTVQSAPSRGELARSRWRETDYLGRLDALIMAPRLRHCATIAVVSPKGGVGKTTTTALLGTLFSLLRRDPTVAVDTNPDYGSLGRVLTPDQTWYVDDLARLVNEDDELSLTALESQLGRAIHGLLVVPSPTEPTRMSELDEGSYHRVITKLKDFFSLILLDCGTGLQDPASAAAIAAADQVVLLTDAQPATASLVAQSAELLRQSGRPITVVVNRMPTHGGRLDLDRLSRYLPAARGLVVIPDEVPAAGRLAGGGFDWRDAPDGWQLALRQLAVVLVSDWHRLGLAN
jgi:MinD-like ATPase involved in chromosome partitioning or flagellar assembly